MNLGYLGITSTTTIDRRVVQWAVLLKTSRHRNGVVRETRQDPDEGVATSLDGWSTLGNGGDDGGVARLQTEALGRIASGLVARYILRLTS